MPLTVREAADRLGVSYSALKRWILQGSVRTTRTAGGHHRIAESELERIGQNEPSSSSRRAEGRRFGGTIVALSGRNQLQGIVEEVRVEGLLGQVRLRIGDQHLTAVITRDAIDELQLKRGQSATAVIKSTEVMLARRAEPPPPRRRARRRRPPHDAR